MKRIRKLARTALLAVATMTLSIFGPGVAYAQNSCPAVCNVSCGGDYACQVLQWMYGCDRRVCD